MRSRRLFLQVNAVLVASWSCGAFQIASRTDISLVNKHHRKVSVFPVTKSSYQERERRGQNSAHVRAVSSSSSDDEETKSSEATLIPVFDFTASNQAASVSSFERIDDAIMGGISTSALRENADKDYSSWSGICRLEGGGFCGMRTLPFKEPLETKHADGIFVECRLGSDDEPERRVWKVTLRTNTSRGEMVYQAQFTIPKDNKDQSQEMFVCIKVPFSDFKLVRGPRMVPDAPAVDTSSGIYQIGLSMSKFIIGLVPRELENFRPGFFELQIRRIGFFKIETFAVEGSVTTPSVAANTISKQEAEKKRPTLLKIFSPIAKVFFSEQSRRRRSAMSLLKKRGLSRGRAILWGIKSRKNSYGLIRSLAKTTSIISIDVLRTVTSSCLRLLFLPVGLLFRMFRFVKKNNSPGPTATTTQ